MWGSWAASRRNPAQRGMWDRDRSAHDDAVLGVEVAEAAEQEEREPRLGMAGTLSAQRLRNGYVTVT